MDTQFWMERWTEGQIGFHLDEVNPALVRNWTALAETSLGPVLVPLCGKSKDLPYLRNLGHKVTGIELSPVAVESFWEESGVAADVHQDGSHRIFEADGITLIEGDFFTVKPTQFAKPAWVYDRAALIAMPPSMRENYVRQLLHLAGHAPILLITLDHDPKAKDGPPFPLSPSDVESLFGATHGIDILESMEVLDHNPAFKSQGVTSLIEWVYLLTPH